MPTLQQLQLILRCPETTTSTAVCKLQALTALASLDLRLNLNAFSGEVSCAATRRATPLTRAGVNLCRPLLWGGDLRHALVYMVPLGAVFWLLLGGARLRSAQHRYATTVRYCL
jgi:hypothetical protein